MGKSKPSLRRKAISFVTDLTTVILNPISDRSSSADGSKASKDPSAETDSGRADGPDTRHFGAFLSSLIWSSESTSQSKEKVGAENGELDESSSEIKKKVCMKEENSSPSNLKGKVPRKSMFTKGKKTLGRAMHKAVRISGYSYNNKSEPRIGSSRRNSEQELMPMKRTKSKKALKAAPKPALPDISEPSVLLDKSMRRTLHGALPLRARGRNWVLLYRTRSHGMSLTTLYRRSLMCPGYYLLVVGDQKGAVFGGLVEAPLKPSNMKYQGSNSTFVFTSLPSDPSEESDLPSDSPSEEADLPTSSSKEADLLSSFSKETDLHSSSSKADLHSSSPVIFPATGANRYFTLCSPNFLALGGGGHFALYLDGELMHGSSFVSDTFDNPCLACSAEFQIKEIELWGFVHASKYKETLELCRMEDAPGISRWLP